MMRSSSKDRIKVAVDLTPMLPGGKNGGVKPAILEFVAGLQRLSEPQFSFLFLTPKSTHAEIQTITTEHDEALCMDLKQAAEAHHSSFFRRRCVDLLYAPFGMISYPDCGIPIISMVVDVL